MNTPRSLFFLSIFVPAVSLLAGCQDDAKPEAPEAAVAPTASATTATTATATATTTTTMTATPDAAAPAMSASAMPADAGAKSDAGKPATKK